MTENVKIRVLLSDVVSMLIVALEIIDQNVLVYQDTSEIRMKGVDDQNV